MGPEILDPIGNQMNQDGDMIFGEPAEDRFTGIISFATPDLTIESIGIPDSVDNGEIIDLTWVGRNDGVQVTSAWTDRVVLSVDPFLGNADDWLLASVPISETLLPGQTYNGSAQITVPFGMEGDATLFVTSDSRDDVFEFQHGFTFLKFGLVRIF